jgi:hypothetical protein
MYVLKRVVSCRRQARARSREAVSLPCVQCAVRRCSSSPYRLHHCFLCCILFEIHVLCPLVSSLTTHRLFCCNRCSSQHIMAAPAKRSSKTNTTAKGGKSSRALQDRSNRADPLDRSAKTTHKRKDREEQVGSNALSCASRWVSYGFYEAPCGAPHKN